MNGQKKISGLQLIVILKMVDVKAIKLPPPEQGASFDGTEV